jgi:hypothetical protein
VLQVQVELKVQSVALVVVELKAQKVDKVHQVQPVLQVQ